LQGKSSFRFDPTWILLFIKLPLFNWFMLRPMQCIRVWPCKATRDEKLCGGVEMGAREKERERERGENENKYTLAGIKN
jgi:hypothetical protein